MVVINPMEVPEFCHHLVEFQCTVGKIFILEEEVAQMVIVVWLVEMEG
jgi:hypothetical protein